MTEYTDEITLSGISLTIDRVNTGNGWRDRFNMLVEDDDEAGILEHLTAKVMLVVTETAEAVEELRDLKVNEVDLDETYYTIDKHRVVKQVIDGEERWVHKSKLGPDHWKTWPADTPAKPEGFPSELADIVIRTIDLMGMVGVDVAEEIWKKVEYNKTRGYLHGKSL